MQNKNYHKIIGFGLVVVCAGFGAWWFSQGKHTDLKNNSINPQTAAEVTHPASTAGVTNTAGTANTAGVANTTKVANTTDNANPTAAPAAVTNPLPNTTVATKDAPTAPGVTEKEKVTPALGCLSWTFTHAKTPGHKDRESCTQHRNLVKIPAIKDLNLKSLCVRVDGTPVRFETQKQGDEVALLIGAIAGPGSKITIRGCGLKATCNDDCKIPKDEFMASIGGDEEADAPSPNRKIAKWDPHQKEEAQGLSAEMDAEIQKEIADAQNLKTFNGWNTDHPTGIDAAGVCGKMISKAK